MKKQLTEKTVYQPNSRVKITVTNKPVLNDSGVTDRYAVSATIAVDAGSFKERLTFGTDDDIAKFIENIDVEDPQTALDVEEK